MVEPQDDRSKQAVAYHWASQVISIAMEMVLPGLAGYWLDQKLGTRVVFTLVGFTGGLTLGIRHLLQLAGAANASTTSSRQRHGRQLSGGDFPDGGRSPDNSPSPDGGSARKDRGDSSAKDTAE